MLSTTAVSVIYIILGLFGTVENAATALLIGSSKEMRNPSYSYIIQVCICDAIVLQPIALYSGLALLWPQLDVELARKAGGYLTALGWYPGCYFMVLTAISRWVQLKHSRKVAVYFTKRVITASIIVSYALPAATYSCVFYHEPLVFTHYPLQFTWGFDRSHSLGNALAIVNICSNCLCAVLITFFNAKSLWFIYLSRKRIQIHRRSQRREVKLFVQCAITGSIYVVAVLYFFIASSLNYVTAVEHLITHLIWISNHLQNPIVYFVLNVALRRRFLKCFDCCRRTTTSSSAVSKKCTINAAGVPMRQVPDSLLDSSKTALLAVNIDT